MKSNSLFIRRIFAAAIDYILLYGAAILFFIWQLPPSFFYYPSIHDIPKTPLFWGLCALLFLLPLFRNLLFGYASLGKLLFGLRIYDKETGKKASVGKLILRGVCFVFPQIDLIVFLVTKSSIGDLMTGTVVLEKHRRKETV